ncbi:MAG: FAD-binding protein, partial [Oscillospiraceae bacterium]|nr:FAD-binding protein [Oscillospiraceae bacterium]
GNAMLRRNMTYAWSVIDGGWAEKIPATLPYGGGIFWDVDHAPDEPGFTVEGTKGLIERGMARGVVVKADTPEELARLIGVPEETFAETLRRYNEMCKNGEDTEFGKRSELMIPLDKPPYYALKFGPASLAVVGGLRVDVNMNVQNENNISIPGLYAIGNVAGGRYGMDYPMLIPGNSHGTALTFGYILGDILAGKEVI